MRTLFLAMVLCVGCGGEGPVGTDAGHDQDGGGGTCTPACPTGQTCVGGTCQSMPVCGDGHVDPGEECDDGNPDAFDGCEPASSPTPCHFSCRVDEDCRDGVECNGNESCALHVCNPGVPLDDGTTCMLTGGASGVCRAGATCVASGCGNGVVDGTEHCDDGNSTNGDGCETDCRFSCEVTGATTTNSWYVDCDGDDYASATVTAVMQCLAPAPDTCGGGWTRRRPVAGAADCDDTRADVHPGVPEICDGLDNDCANGPDDGVANACGTCGPVPEEVCDGVDNDCDGARDEGLTVTLYADSDGDGHGNPAAGMMLCPGTGGYTSSNDDCADANGNAHPGQTAYFTSPNSGGSGVPVGGFDYDCSGTAEHELIGTDAVCSRLCLPPPRGCLMICFGDGWTGSTEPACGEFGTYRTCTYNVATGGCNTSDASRQQGCH